MTPNYAEKVYAELNHDIAVMNAKNLNQPVYTRQMTAEEIENIFGGNPDYIKNITKNDGREWNQI